MVSGVGKVTHLQFPDDTLVFCDADGNQLDFLGQVLTWFLQVSGLKINLRKHCHVCPSFAMQGRCSTTYLELPLGALNKDLCFRNSVIQRVEKRLAGWQKRYLSKGGKEVLIEKFSLGCGERGKELSLGLLGNRDIS